MRRETYERIRVSYYLGIFLLAIYALPKVGFIKEFLYPLFNYELIPEMPVITIVAILTGIGAFMAFKYRKIG